jgi:predicted metal-dependent hydrolase
MEKVRMTKILKKPEIKSNVEAKTVELVSVGPIKMERSSRAKHISVSVRPYRGVRVAVPRGVSFARAESFARSKAGWIKKNVAKMEQMERAARILSEKSPLDRRAAGKQLVDRLDSLALKHGFQYNRVFIRNQKTRWGSCSGKNNINLNVNLVRLPDELRDYTILHELVHTRIKNHGKRFWAQLDRLLGDAAKLDRALNDYNFLLFVKT